jgi:hypothetical protein
VTSEQDQSPFELPSINDATKLNIDTAVTIVSATRLIGDWLLPACVRVAADSPMLRVGDMTTSTVQQAVDGRLLAVVELLLRLVCSTDQIFVEWTLKSSVDEQESSSGSVGAGKRMPHPSAVSYYASAMDAASGGDVGCERPLLAVPVVGIVVQLAARALHRQLTAPSLGSDVLNSLVTVRTSCLRVMRVSVSARAAYIHCCSDTDWSCTFAPSTRANSVKTKRLRIAPLQTNILCQYTNMSNSGPCLRFCLDTNGYTWTGLCVEQLVMCTVNGRFVRFLLSI